MPDQAIRDHLTRHRKPVDSLTGIRFFAAIYVVFYHSRVAPLLFRSGYETAGNFLSNGYVAVPLFFLLSGFILSYTYRSQLAGPRAWHRFYEARFARVWPVYLVSLLASSLAGMSPPAPLQTLATILMLQAWNPFNLGLAGAWNFVCWTLSVEAFFYVVFPGVQVMVERFSLCNLRWLLGVALSFCVAFNLAPKAMAHPAPGIFHYLPLPILHLPEFLAGVALGNCFLQLGGRARVSQGSRWTYAAFPATIFLLCLPPSRGSSTVVVALAALLWGLAREQTLLTRLLSNRAVLVGGQISYSIYLMQLPVKAFSLMVAQRIRFGSEILRLGITMTMLILIAWLLFIGVETPARQALRFAFAKIEGRS